MFKKAFQIVVAFSAMVGAYQAYLLGFAALTARIGDDRGAVVAPFVHVEAKTAKEATRLAEESFGKDHWAARKNLKIRVYDAERGFFMYAGDYTRLENGKKFEFWPFAIVWQSKDGKSRKTATSVRAKIELNEALNLVKPGAASMHVVEATLEDNVVLRDDKGTRLDPTDDMIVGALPYITYSEKTDPPQIVSVSDIRLVDRDLVLTGYDLLIELRKREGVAGPAGFDAKTAILRKNVHIAAQNAGRDGVLPGLARGTGTGGSTPVDLKSDAEMRIDFPPKPKLLNPKLAGPPEQEGPTIATFHRNVVVVRGTTLPDALNCDTLRLTLLPTLREPDPPCPVAPAAIVGAAVFDAGSNGLTSRSVATGPLTELALREANARGHAVWLRSIAQGMTAKCNELIYKKLAPAAPDETYLRANLNRQIEVNKVDTAGPTPGTGAVTSVTTVWAADAKVFDDGKGGAASTVLARGPGRLESRSGLDKPAEQSAVWNGELIMRTTSLGPTTVVARGEAAPTRRQITLTGDPKLIDHVKAMTLEAKTSIIVSLKPRPRPPADGSSAKPATTKPTTTASATPPTGATGPLASGSFQIEWLQARENVRLTAPGKTMIARDSLDAPFEEVAAVVEAAPPDPKVSGGSLAAATPTVAPATPGQAAVAKVDEKEKDKDQEKKPAEPAVTVTSHRIWAKIRQGANGGKSEIAEARLRGAVKFHQDPAPDKARGIDVAGEALDLESVGGGRMKFRVFDTDPSALGGGARLAARGEPRLDPPSVATIDTDDYAIRGPVIGLDQSTDFAWVRGPGSFTQLADRGFLSEKGVQGQVKAQGHPAPEEKGKKSPMVIAWSREMRFYGRTTDLAGRPAGKAEFRGDVDARMEDGRIVADALDTYTDRPVSLVAPPKPETPKANPRVKSAAKADTALIDQALTVSAANPEDIPLGRPAPGTAPAAGDEPKPELAYLDARARKDRRPDEDGVIVISIRKDPATGEWIEKQRIEGEQVVYDKRTGDYSVPGKGHVYLWRRSAAGPSRPGLPGGPLPTARRAETRPVANGPRDLAKVDEPKKTFGPWELTKVKFNEMMTGRFGVGKDRDQTEPRTADFYGGVEVINAVVVGTGSDLSFDSRPAGFKFMTADSLRIVDFPPPPDVKDRPARHMLTAEGNAHARTNTHAIAADLLTYDSFKDLFYAYGQGGREVVIADQAHPGQPGSNARGDAAVYNHKTGAAELMNPSTISFLDGATGVRPKAESLPGPAGAQPRNTRPALRPPPRGHIERKSF